ncbi:MAG: alpha/beta hydrolase [Bdellovibrionales bacterium]|jgi:pimeloyl-ACP methyl ester carboxylesterase
MKTDFFLGLNAKGFHKIAVHQWTPQQAGGVPVVCVHGLTRHGRDFDVLAKRLSKGCAVYCPDMAGRGQSDDLPDSKSYNFDQYKNDLTALLARIGAAQVDWVGTSMGGLLGMMLAALPNTPIRRLVLNDVGPLIPQKSLDRIGTYIGQQPVFDTVEALEAHMRTIYASFGVPSDKDWAALAATGHRQRADGRFVLAYDTKIADAYKGQNKAVNLWETYDKIACPVLVLRGAQSDLLPREAAQEMTQRGPHARLIEIEGCGHAPALMSDEQIKMIEDFLEGKTK